MARHPFWVAGHSHAHNIKEKVMRKMLTAVAASLVVLTGCASTPATPAPQVTVTVPASPTATPTPPPAPVVATPTPTATSDNEELVGMLVDLAWADMSKSDKNSMCLLYVLYPQKAKRAFLDGTSGGIAGATAAETWAAMKAHLNDVC